MTYLLRCHASTKIFLFFALAAFSIGCGDCAGTATQGDGTDSPLCNDAECLDSGVSDTGLDATDAAQPDAQQPDADTSPDTTTEVCDPANQCGEECCTSAQLCLNEACVSPGADCAHNLECPTGEVCEPTFGKCLPDSGVVCEFRPPTHVFEPEVATAWVEDETTPEPDYHQVMMTPAVLDMNEDGVPDIVFSTFRGGAYTAESILRGIDGRTFEPIFDLVDVAKRVSGAASIALGDIDGDGRNEIVAVLPSSSRGLIAIDDHTTGWAVKWETDAFGMHWAGPALVDLDGDGSVEVIAANRVYDAATGALKCIASGLATTAVDSTAVDLNGDGNQEVIAGNGAFQFIPDGSGGYDCPVYWQYSGGGGGYPAVGDFGTFTGDTPVFGQLDGIPEVVTTSGSSIHLSNGQTGENIWTATLPSDGHKYYTPAQCTTNGIGPPTVADFDGDGAPEIGAAGACFYVVYETDGSMRWKHSSQDFSSRVTGSSVFDFQGDGKAEVVYADECFLRVYDGAGNDDGTTEILYKRSHTSGTTRELPVIVDVDGDYHADIVYISNDYSGVGAGCSARWEEFDAENGIEHGVFVAKDAQNRWVSTRQVWNQHAYHVTNVCDGVDDSLCPGRINKPGAIPIGQKNNWEMSYMNNFRQNVQGEGLFNAPDLEISNAKTDCDGQGLRLRLTIANRGTRGVLAGVNVAVWITIDGVEQYLTTLTTTQDLPPGGRETIEYDWPDAPSPSGQEISIRAVADSDELGNAQHNECHEDNNEISNAISCACTENRDCDPGEFCASTGECLPMDG